MYNMSLAPASHLCRRPPSATVAIADSIFDGNSALAPEAAVNARWMPMAYGEAIEGIPVIETALSGGGGAIALLKTLQGSSNMTHGGSGVKEPRWVNTASCTISDTTIVHNTASSGGGGIIAKNVDIALANCTVEHNRAKTIGGGVLVARGTAALAVSDSIVRENVAREGGSQIDGHSNAAVRLKGVLVSPPQPTAADSLSKQMGDESATDNSMMKLAGVAPLSLAAGTEIRCPVGRRLVYSGDLETSHSVEVTSKPKGRLLAVSGFTASVGCSKCPGNLILPPGAAGLLQFAAVDTSGGSKPEITTNWTECQAPPQCKAGSWSPTGGQCTQRLPLPHCGSFLCGFT